MPKVPDGAFYQSYKNGLRAIIIGIPNEQETRRYFGTPFNVPFYLEETWSFCRIPTVEESHQAMKILDERDWPGERLDAICKIDLDGEVVIRGLITSVPRV